MDLEIVPLELRLYAFAKLRLLFFSVTVFDACLWKYKMEAIKWNIFDTISKKEDDSPPKIGSASSSKRSAGHGGCEIKQIEGRHPADPAFLLEIDANDEVSDVTLSYGIGTHPGGVDIKEWSAMSGSSLTAPYKMNAGVPLYWTVKAANSGGQVATTQCSLHTYDTTVPDGRIEASYRYTSHRNQISGTVFVFDDSPLVDQQYQAAGFSKGRFGTEVANWNPLQLHSSHTRNISNAMSPLRYFSIPRAGKLTVLPFKLAKSSTDELCAKECIEFGLKCVSFNYDHNSENCELCSVVEGPSGKLRISGMFKNYERLGVGFNSLMQYDLDLKHGSLYYLNAEITNTLGYTAFLSSDGTMVDFTPPDPGPVGNTSRDQIVSDICHAAITQRCIDVTSEPNHRKIIDGEGSATVFNGHESSVDNRYTLINYYASGNWDGFYDKQSGIYGYTWAVGTGVCLTDIANFSDPHAHLSSRRFWTNTGYARNIHLPDGKYYVTVQALNNVVHGGALVTTVCHSQPFSVDTTAPVFQGITDIIFDEDFDFMAIYFDTNDPLSNISRIDFGLGKTKHDVAVRGYSSFDYNPRTNPYIFVKDLHMDSGSPSWIRLRAVNKVGLFTTGHSDNPILIDRTPPVAGHVVDGDVMDADLQFQSRNNTICAQWTMFYDPESGIDNYAWGVGSKPGTDDVKPFSEYPHSVKEMCAMTSLQHNHTYYSTVKATNAALNSKSNRSSSDGVLVDVTSPIAGKVQDGPKPGEDIQFSSETAEIAATWMNFSDPESGIEAYSVDVKINGNVVETFNVGTADDFTDYSLNFNHGDSISVRLMTTNGAGMSTVVESDGFVVDMTGPDVQYVRETNTGSQYQSDTHALNLQWFFTDVESGMRDYKYTVFAHKRGNTIPIYPLNKDFEIIQDSSEGDEKGQPVSVTINQTLSSGTRYTVKVSAINNAGMPTSQESTGVMVDMTPPQIVKVHIGMMNVPEELDDSSMYILQVDQQTVTVSWSASDPESGITKTFVAIGTSPNDTSVTQGFVEFGNVNTAALTDLNLKVSESQDRPDPIYYYVTVRVSNGAGLEVTSTPGMTKPLKVLKANVPGTVYDGRTPLKDVDFTDDKTSLAMSFNGFQSEACNIVGYEWAIGFEPLASDVLSYTEYGIVLMNDTYGHAQIPTELYEGSTYYISVRAMTGHNCREDYIYSTSDGITLDTTPPHVQMMKFGDTLVKPAELTTGLFQARTDSLEFKWRSTDDSDILKNWWSIGSLPGLHNIHNITITNTNQIPAGSVHFGQGQTFFLNTGASDKAGNEHIVSSPPITVDTSFPAVSAFTCTPYISVRQSLVKCHWDMLKEYESAILSFAVGVGAGQLDPDISDFHDISIMTRIWTRDFRSKITSNNLANVYVLIQIKNVLNMTKIHSQRIVVDRTPPVDGTVEIITSLSSEGRDIKQLCQVPQTYVEFTIRNWTDPESDIFRYEAGVGYDDRLTTLKDFHEVDATGKVTINGLGMRDGMSVRVTVRAYNKAGLFSQVTSHEIIISSQSILEVRDGRGAEDFDYQTSLNILEGSWYYSDRCPILYSEWAVEDVTGRIKRNSSTIPDGSNHFYSDIITLVNGITYINVIRVRDALNRTRTGRSDGVTVHIQPPMPGTVRDGVDEDTNYQESVEVLDTNWDRFGSSVAKDPTQKIVRYEVAIGNDRRYVKTRTNVHYFTNVGLNTSHTFAGLNLTARTVTYYMTVRAYSAAGSFDESYSNGIKVGYREEIMPGTVDVNPVQSKTRQMSVSWSGFQADMGISYYQVGLTEYLGMVPNITLDCNEMQRELNFTDTVKLQKVGKDSYYEFLNVTLQHRHRYTVLVVAADMTGVCAAITSEPVRIDTTPPIPGTVIVHGTTGPNVIFVNDRSELRVSWTPFIDPESHVKEHTVELHFAETCKDDGSVEVVQAKYSKIDSVIVYNDNSTVFYDMAFKNRYSYVVMITASNGADLSSHVRSPAIRVDTTAPLIGNVRNGLSWERDINFQPFHDRIQGTTAIARSKELYNCPRQEVIIPSDNLNSVVRNLGGEFIEDCLTQAADKSLVVSIKHDDSLTKILQGGFKLDSDKVKEGTYSFVLKAAQGMETITTIFIGFDIGASLSNFTFQAFGNISNVMLELHDDTDTENVSAATTYDDLFNITTSSSIVETTEGTEAPNTANNTKAEDKRLSESPIDRNDLYGVGIHIPGYRYEGRWVAFLFVRDRYRSNIKQIELDANPTASFNEYNLHFDRIRSPTSPSWAVETSINGASKSYSTGLSLQEAGITSVYTWTRNNYFPPVIDPFNPFHGKVVLKQLLSPLPLDKPCMHGNGFFDAESSIREIRLGVSDSPNATDSVSPMSLFKSLCTPCSGMCNIACDEHCSDPAVLDDFQFIHIETENLTLLQTQVHTNYTGENGMGFNTSTYYLNVEVVNMAGLTTLVSAKPVMVDETPPSFEYVRCVDPSNSMDEPSAFQGTNNSMGAYWECDEDIGDIVEYNIMIGSKPDVFDVLPMTALGLEKKVKVDNLEGKLQHAHTYYLTVTAVNSAGLTSRQSCNVTVEVFPPDVSNLTTSPLFTLDPNSISDTLITTDDHNIGLEWSGGKSDVEFYEWMIGSKKDSDDIFPKVKVALTSSHKIRLLNGEIWLDSSPLNSSVGEFAKKNWTKEAVEQAKQNTFIRLEPGACYHMTLFAVGRSHLTIPVYAKPVCVKGQEKKRMQSHGYTSGRVQLHNGTCSAILTIKGNTILAAVLTQRQIRVDYGSAASANYKRYIVNIGDHLDQSTRFLRNRLTSNIGMVFFISPTTNFTDTDGNDVTLTFSDVGLHYDQTTYEPAVVYWDKDDGVVRHLGYECGNKDNKPDYRLLVNNKISICREVFKPQSPSRQRRSASTHASPSPRMFAVVAIKNTVQNTAPQLLTSQLSGLEDDVTEHVIDYYDAEGDDVVFTITTPPRHGVANISDKNRMYYNPEKNYNGQDEVTISATEINLSPPFAPHTVHKTLIITVDPVNDPPIIMYSTGSDVTDFFRIKTDAEEIHIKFEGNTTQKYHLGTITGHDIDALDNMTRLLHYTTSSLTKFVYETDITSDTNDQIRLWIKVDQDYHGSQNFSVRYVDRLRKYSKEITVMSYVMINPCYHGKCQNETDVPCSDTIRTSSFDTYSCTCGVGYTGQWCETDINECSAHDCSVFYDCEDMIGRYQCNLNVPKTLGLAVSIAVVGIVLFMLARRFNKLGENRKISLLKKHPSEDIKSPLVMLTARAIEPFGLQIDNSEGTVAEGSLQSTGDNNGSVFGHNTERTEDRIGTDGGVRGRTHSVKYEMDDDIAKAIVPLEDYSRRIGYIRPPHFDVRHVKNISKRGQHDGENTSGHVSPNTSDQPAALKSGPVTNQISNRRGKSPHDMSKASKKGNSNVGESQMDDAKKAALQYSKNCSDLF